jgi:hypothetical protein
MCRRDGGSFEVARLCDRAEPELSMGEMARKREANHTVDVAVALVILTGVDSGPSSRPWGCLAVQVGSERQCKAHQAYPVCLMRRHVCPGELGPQG